MATRLTASIEANRCADTADLVAFPVEYWSVKTESGVRDVPIGDREQFVDHCAEYIDAFTRSHIRKAKLARLADGRYALMWATKELEFTFEIGQDTAGEFASSIT